MGDFRQSAWYQYMDQPLRDLAGLSFSLLEQQKETSYFDYGFVVFPIAKAYEGFLKKMFFDMGLINKQQFHGEHFRIGKALNPNLPIRYRSGWVFESLIQSCGGEHLPMQLWEAWKNARNQVFHYFPSQEEHTIAYSRAEALVLELAGAMEEAVRGCELGR